MNKPIKIIAKQFTPEEAVVLWDKIALTSKKTNSIIVRNPNGGIKPVEEISKALGIGVEKLSQARQIIKSENEELIKEMNATGNVSGAYNKLQRIKIKAAKEDLREMFKPSRSERERIQMWIRGFSAPIDRYKSEHIESISKHITDKDVEDIRKRITELSEWIKTLSNNKNLLN